MMPPAADALAATTLRLEKAPTGIRGFDQVVEGGLPRGRPTLITGGAGTGKTLFAVEFLARGALEFDEPGVLLAFEETHDELCVNVASLGFDLAQLERDGRLLIDEVELVPADAEAGSYDLDGLFVRLAAAVDAIGARRVVLDTVEVLFAALRDQSVVRSELSRLFRWLKSRGLTAVVTGERGEERQLTRFGIEEYISDCVIVLDHRVAEELSTRRLRVVKYRGSLHGTNEYPFLITDRGLSVAPITSVSLTYPAPSERTSTGVPRLDRMLGGGVFRGSAILVTGDAGTGKTTIAAHIATAACERGERALFISFEESPSALVRNMSSVGVDLDRWIQSGQLRLWSARPTAYGLEEHLATLRRLLEEATPDLVVLDAVAALTLTGDTNAVLATISRDIDLLKLQGITGVLTSLTNSAVDFSSIVDTWLLLRNVESDGERNRLLFVIKSRGAAHSNQVREFQLTDHGAELLDVYVGPQGVLTGAARLTQEAQDRRAKQARAAEIDRARRALARRTTQIEAKIVALRTRLDNERDDVERLAAAAADKEAIAETDREVIAAHRRADEPVTERADQS